MKNHLRRMRCASFQVVLFYCKTGKEAQDAASVAATGHKLSQVEEAVRLWEKGLKAATKAVKTSDRAVSPEQAKAERAKNNTAQGGGKMSLDHKYWKPKLSQSEWDLVTYEMNRQIESDENFLDPITKWLYAKSKGTEVFAIYGIGDGSEATMLYADGGTKANKDYQAMQDYLGGKQNGTNRNWTAIDRLLKSMPDARSGKGNRILDARERGGEASDVPFPVRTQASNSGADNGGSEENSRKVKFSIDLDYMDAVNRGDTEAAQKMVDEAAKQAGYPIRALHGTWDSRRRDNFGRFIPGSDFTVFDSKMSVADKVDRYGFYFTSNRNLAEFYAPDLDEYDSMYNSKRTPKIYDVYLSMTNPYIIDGNGSSWRKIADENIAGRKLLRFAYQDIFTNEIRNRTTFSTKEIVKWAKEEGYDGVIFKNIIDGDERDPALLGDVYAVFSPDQIKSADPVTYDDNGNVIPLSERFNSENRDIRYSIEGTENIIDEVRAARQVENAAKAQLSYLRKQVAVTKDATADPKSVERIARKLIASYGVEMDADALAQQLQLYYNILSESIILLYIL